MRNNVEDDNDTELHLAVLADDYKALETLKCEPLLMNAKNGIGFTALELAKFLGKKKCVELLEPAIPHTIRIILRDQSTPKELNESEFKNITGVEYIPCVQFENYEILKQKIRELPSIFKWSLGRQNRKMGILYHDKIWQGYIGDFTIKWIDPVIGYGLFANQDIKIGEYIGELVGKIRSVRSEHYDLNDYCFKYPKHLYLKNFFVIDPLEAGNEMRYANHSDDPNLQPVWAIDRKLLHLIFFAKKPIPKGAQLTFNYGANYWKTRKKLT